MRTLSIAAVLGLLAAWPAVVSAQGPSVAVVPFSGRGSSTMRSRVARALRDRADVLSRRTVDAAASEASVDGTAQSGVAELASSLDADLVFQGEVGGPRRRPSVTLVVRASDGEELARGDATWGRGRRGRNAFESAVHGLWDRAAAALEARRAPPPEPEPILEAEPEPEPEPVSEVPADGLALLAATVGVTIRTREADAALVSGGHRRYQLQSGVYPEIAIGLEARPFANDSHLGRGLFVSGLFAHSLGLASETASSMVAVDATNFMRFELNAGWLAPLADVLELGVVFGGGYDGYHLGTNVVLPTAEYAWLRPGARGRIRVAQETLVIDLSLAYRAVLGIGALAAAFGENAETHGVDVGIGLGGNLLLAAELGFTWGVRFEYVGYFTSYSGPAADEPATSGTEGSVRFALAAGWSFR